MEQVIQIVQIAFFTTAILGAIVSVVVYITRLGGSVKSLENRFTPLENRFTSLENRFTSLENAIQEMRQELKAEIKGVDRKVDALMMHLIGSKFNDKDVK